LKEGGPSNAGSSMVFFAQGQILPGNSRSVDRLRGILGEGPPVKKETLKFQGRERWSRKLARRKGDQVFTPFTTGGQGDPPPTSPSPSTIRGKKQMEGLQMPYKDASTGEASSYLLFGRAGITIMEIMGAVSSFPPVYFG